MGAALVLALAGLVLGTYRVVSGWHPTVPVSPSTTVAQVTSTAAEVDPGATLHQKAPLFVLQNQRGETVGLRQYRGKAVVLAFINSQGTSVSPLTAVVLHNMRHDLGKYRRDVQVLAVNANPVSTSTADVQAWSVAHHMQGQWQFLTGTPSQLKIVWHDYHVTSQVLKGNLVRDIPAVVVIGPSGEERWLYLNASDGSAPVLAAEVHQLMAHIAPLLPGHPSLSAFAAARELTYLPGTLGPQGGQHAFEAPVIRPNGALATVTAGRGGRPILLDFFATWCPDCQEEIPILKRYQQYAVMHHLPQVMGVDLRLSEPTTAHVQHYVVRTRLSYPVALDMHGNIAVAYGVSGIPTEVLISPTGKILWYHQGLIAWGPLLAAVSRHGGL